MIFNIMTLFPDVIYGYAGTSIIYNAIKNKLIKVNVYNIRDYSKNKHKKVDDYPYGGGTGMLMTPQPIYDCYSDIKKKNPDTSLIYFSPKGRVHDNEISKQFAKLSNLTFLCGHYEGIDQRIIDTIVDYEISIGDYVLTGGELPALVMLDSIARKIDGVLSSKENVESESFENSLLEYPQYTRPQDFLGQKVPDVLLSGNHEEIYKWRQNEAKKLTKALRPDLISN